MHYVVGGDGGVGEEGGGVQVGEADVGEGVGGEEGGGEGCVFGLLGGGVSVVGGGGGGGRTVQQPRSTRWCQGAEGGAGVEERVAAMAVRRVAGSSVSWGGGSAWGLGGWGKGRQTLMSRRSQMEERAGWAMYSRRSERRARGSWGACGVRRVLR